MRSLIIEVNERFPLGDCFIEEGKEGEDLEVFGFTFDAEEFYYGTYIDGHNVNITEVNGTVREQILAYVDEQGLNLIEEVLVPASPMFGAIEQLQGYIRIMNGRLLLSINEIKYDGMGSATIKTYHDLLIAEDENPAAKKKAGITNN